MSFCFSWERCRGGALTQNNVGVGSLLGDYGGAGEIAVEKTDGSILGCDRGATFLAADEAGILPVWMRFVECVEGVAADVACGAGSVGLLETKEMRLPGSSHTKTFTGAMFGRWCVLTRCWNAACCLLPLGPLYKITYRNGCS